MRRFLNSSSTWDKKAVKARVIPQRKGREGCQWVAAGVCLILEEEQEEKIRKGERFICCDLPE